MESKSGDKLLKIMEYVILQEEPLRLLDVAKGMEMNSATALRYLTTLVNSGYIEQNPETLKYRPTYKIKGLATHINRDGELNMIARPYLENIAERVGESVCISVEANGKAVYIDVIHSTKNTLIAFQRAGTYSPLHCTGNGKLLLLNYTEEEIDHYIETTGLRKYTEHTITNKKVLMKELDLVRKRGYAYDEQEREDGIRCIAFPIRNAEGKVIAGVSVSGPIERMSDEILNPNISYLREQVMQISEKMGYHII